MLQFENSEAIFLNPDVSDHCPCLIRFNLDMQRRKPMFRFCEMWTDDPSFPQIVREAWSAVVTGTPMFRLTRKLKKVKYDQKFLHLVDKIADKEKSLQEIQTNLQNNPFNVQLINAEKQARMGIP